MVSLPRMFAGFCRVRRTSRCKSVEGCCLGRPGPRLPDRMGGLLRLQKTEAGKHLWTEAPGPWGRHRKKLSCRQTQCREQLRVLNTASEDFRG